MKKQKVATQKDVQNIMEYDDNKTFSRNCIDSVTPVFQQMANVMLEYPTPDNIQLSRFVCDSTLITFKTKLYSDVASLLSGIVSILLDHAKTIDSGEKYKQLEWDLVSEMNRGVRFISDSIMNSAPAFDVPIINDICISEAIYYTNSIKLNLMPAINKFLLPCDSEVHYDFMHKFDYILGATLNTFPLLIRVYLKDVFDITNKIEMFTIQDETPTIKEVFSYDNMLPYENE